MCLLIYIIPPIGILETWREFGGTLVLVRREGYIYLDAACLATTLKPLLNHKDITKFGGSVSSGDMGDSFITLTDNENIES